MEISPIIKFIGFQKYFLQFLNIKPPKILNSPFNATSKYQTYKGGR